MAVSLPTASTSYSFTAGSDSRAVTIDATSNLLLVRTFSRINPGAWTATWDGSSMTALTGSVNSISIYAEWFYLANPTTGSKTLAVTCPNSHPMVVEVFGLAGANTSSPFHSQGANNWLTSTANPGTTPSITLTSATGELCLDGVGIEDAADVTLAVSGGSGTSSMTTIRQGDGTNFERVGGSTAPGASSVTMSWLLGGTKNYIQVGIAVQAASAATLHNLPLLGVG